MLLQFKLDMGSCVFRVLILLLFVVSLLEVDFIFLCWSSRSLLIRSAITVEPALVKTSN